jgi:hypothetical protein
MSGGRFETNIASNPGSVTVKSSLGGQATRTVTGKSNTGASAFRRPEQAPSGLREIEIEAESWSAT